MSIHAEKYIVDSIFPMSSETIILLEPCLDVCWTGTIFTLIHGLSMAAKYQ